MKDILTILFLATLPFSTLFLTYQLSPSQKPYKCPICLVEIDKGTYNAPNYGHHSLVDPPVFYFVAFEEKDGANILKHLQEIDQIGLITPMGKEIFLVQAWSGAKLNADYLRTINGVKSVTVRNKVDNGGS